MTAAEPRMVEPILVTGSHRSGTTWTGRMLSLGPEVGYIHEPFNPRRRPGWSGNRIPYWYLHITSDNAAYYEDVVERFLAFRYPIADNLRDAIGPRGAAQLALDLKEALRARARGARPLVKDPLALFSADWLAQRFSMRVVVMIRRPVAFVGSIKRLNWQFRFRSWLAQDSLQRDLLAPFHDDMHRCWSQRCDIVEQGIVMWNALHHVVDLYRQDHRDWIFVRHEDLAADPLCGFKDLYERLGLRWDERVAATIARSASADNPTEVPRWRHQAVRRDSRAATQTWTTRLSADEIDRVEKGTAEIAHRFYA